MSPRGIIFKLIVVLTSTVLLVSILSIIFFSTTSSRISRTNLENSMSNFSRISRLGYSTPLWHLNNKEIQNLNYALLANEDVTAINIYEGEHFIAGLSKDPKTGQIDQASADKKYSIPSGRTEIKIISDDILYDGKKIGKFEIFYSQRLVNEEIFRSNVNLVISFIIIALSIIVAVFLLVRGPIINPILELARVSDEIATGGNYSLRASKKAEDEIGLLYDRFNLMLDEIQSSRSELEKSRNMLSNIIESMPSVLISMDEQGKVTQWNSAAEISTGIRAADILGRNLWESTDYLDKYKDSIVEVINKKKPVQIYRQKFDESGTSFKNINMFPLISNGISGLVIRVDDITELERKEDQLRQVQKMETIGTLAGGLAHDFNNVLGGIVGNTSLFKFKVGQGQEVTVEQIRRYIETIENLSQRATDMVQQLLSLSRRKELTFRNVDLNDTIDNVVKICRSTFDKAVQIRPIHATGENAIIQADPGEIEQVLLNLCVNGYHAMSLMRPAGQPYGGTLTISVEPVSADKYFCSTHPEAVPTDYWKLSVQDTGVGMDSRTIAKIFDPFFTTKERGRGTGLGLAMAYNIVQQHGGFIDVYSEVGIGSTFSIYLPFSEVKPEGKEKMEEKIIKGEGLVLVVDDEPFMRELADDMLTLCGYKVLLAANGDEGVEVFRREHQNISLVLLDMVMPKKSGKEAFVEMKKIDENVKVLLASGFRSDERVDEILALGVRGFVQKPYTIHVLSKEIEKVINSK